LVPEPRLLIDPNRPVPGIDVRGLFHRTAVDNDEWLHDYDVSFGIIDRERTIRTSAYVLAREATARPGKPFEPIVAGRLTDLPTASGSIRPL
jgi:hypothetical protein